MVLSTIEWKLGPPFLPPSAAAKGKILFQQYVIVMI